MVLTTGIHLSQLRNPRSICCPVWFPNEDSSRFMNGYLFTVSSHSRERKQAFFLWGYLIPSWGPHPHEPKQPTSNTITLGGRALIYEFEAWTHIQSTTISSRINCESHLFFFCSTITGEKKIVTVLQQITLGYTSNVLGDSLSFSSAYGCLRWSLRSSQGCKSCSNMNESPWCCALKKP